MTVTRRSTPELTRRAFLAGGSAAALALAGSPPARAGESPIGVLRGATEAGRYDLVMPAYNICNGGYLEGAIRAAAFKGAGIIAMKAAMAVATQHKRLRPIPDWRIKKVNRIVPGDLKPPLKAYLWVLQNPHVAAVNSNLWDETYVRENLSVAGKKVTLQAG